MYRLFTCNTGKFRGWKKVNRPYIDCIETCRCFSSFVLRHGVPQWLSEKLFFPSKGLRSEGLNPIVLHVLRQLASDSFAQWLMLISEFLLFAGKFFALRLCIPGCFFCRKDKR